MIEHRGECMSASCEAIIWEEFVSEEFMSGVGADGRLVFIDFALFVGDVVGPVVEMLEDGESVRTKGFFDGLALGYVDSTGLDVGGWSEQGISGQSVQ